MIALVSRRPALLLIVIAFLGFISLGLPDGLLSVAWPSIRGTFGLPLDSLGLLLLAGTSGYMLSSFNSGRIIAWLGVGRLLALSCALTGGALIGYTLVPLWPMFVALAFVAGLGAGAIDAGLNTYVADNHGPGLMQWLHASFGIGTTLGPLIMTATLSAGRSWRVGYVTVGAAQLALASVFWVTARLWVDGSQKKDDNAILAHRTAPGQSLRLPEVQLSALLFLIYAGVEISAGQLAYTVLTESRGIAPQAAGLWVSAYWGLFTVGRVVAGLIAHRLPTTTLIRLSMGGAFVGALLFWLNPAPPVGAMGLVVVGFSVAPIFPSLITNTAERVGVEHAANTIGFQISATGFGVAILPGLTTLLARSLGLEFIGLSIAAAAFGIIVIHEAILRLHRLRPERA